MYFFISYPSDQIDEDEIDFFKKKIIIIFQVLTESNYIINTFCNNSIFVDRRL